MVELNIYNLEKREGKNGKEYYILDTDLGSVYIWEDSFEGNFEDSETLKDKLVDADVTCGQFQTLKEIKEILGTAKKIVRIKDKDRTISRIASINSAVKILELGECNRDSEINKKKVFETAEEIFKFITK